MRDLAYRNIPQIAATHNATTPAPPAGFRGVAYSTTLGALVVWTGTAWRRVPRGYDIPAGGTAGQVLTKSGAGDTEFGWATPSGGGGGGGAAGDDFIVVAPQTDDFAFTEGASTLLQSGSYGAATLDTGYRPPALAFMTAYGIRSHAVQPHFADIEIASWRPAGNGTGVTQLGFAAATTGTATAANVTVTNRHTARTRLEYAVTTASTSAVAGIRGLQNFMMGRSSRVYGGFYAKFVFGPSRGAAANSTRRWFVGFAGTGNAPTDVNPSGWNANLVGIGCDAGDTNFQFIPGLNKQDLGIAKSSSDNTRLFEAEFFSRPGSDQDFRWRFREVGVPASISGGNVDFRFGGPSNADTLLCPHIWTSVGGTSSVIGVSVYSMYFERYYGRE